VPQVGDEADQESDRPDDEADDPEDAADVVVRGQRAAGDQRRAHAGDDEAGHHQQDRPDEVPGELGRARTAGPDHVLSLSERDPLGDVSHVVTVGGCGVSPFGTGTDGI
jgi:hypothetical protein